MSAVPAPPWRRLAAACYDALLLLALWMVALLASLFVHQLFGLARNDHANAVLLFLAGLAFFGWSWTHGGQTLGMRAWRLRLCRDNGGAVRWPVAAGRYALMLLSWLMALALLVLPLLPPAVAARVPHPAQVLEACAAYTLLTLLLPFLDRRRRTLHDRLAGTEVQLLPRDAV
ncbi:MAG TPA: RDD family protein [Nevskia sp.]|nr:RDD family protein [Nevskia sp.]